MVCKGGFLLYEFKFMSLVWIYVEFILIVISMFELFRGATTGYKKTRSEPEALSRVYSDRSNPHDKENADELLWMSDDEKYAGSVAVARYIVSKAIDTHHSDDYYPRIFTYHVPTNQHVYEASGERLEPIWRSGGSAEQMVVGKVDEKFVAEYKLSADSSKKLNERLDKKASFFRDTLSKFRFYFDDSWKNTLRVAIDSIPDDYTLMQALKHIYDELIKKGYEAEELKEKISEIVFNYLFYILPIKGVFFEREASKEEETIDLKQDLTIDEEVRDSQMKLVDSLRVSNIEEIDEPTYRAIENSGIIDKNDESMLVDLENGEKLYLHKSGSIISVISYQNIQPEDLPKQIVKDLKAKNVSFDRARILGKAQKIFVIDTDTMLCVDIYQWFRSFLSESEVFLSDAGFSFAVEEKDVFLKLIQTEFVGGIINGYDSMKEARAVMIVMLHEIFHLLQKESMSRSDKLKTSVKLKLMGFWRGIIRKNELTDFERRFLDTKNKTGVINERNAWLFAILAVRKLQSLGIDLDKGVDVREYYDQALSTYQQQLAYYPPTKKLHLYSQSARRWTRKNTNPNRKILIKR